MLSPAQSLYLLGCLSSFSLVGLTFGLRSGLAPLLRSRSSRRTRLAPCCDTISGDTLTPRYADLFTRAFSQSQSLRGRDLHPACVLRLLTSPTLLRRLHGVSLRSC